MWTLQTGRFPKRILLQSEQKSHFLNSFPVTEMSANKRHEVKGERVQDSVPGLPRICHTPLVSQRLQRCPHVTRDDVTLDLLLFPEHFEVFV